MGANVSFPISVVSISVVSICLVSICLRTIGWACSTTEAQLFIR